MSTVNINRLSPSTPGQIRSHKNLKPSKAQLSHAIPRALRHVRSRGNPELTALARSTGRAMQANRTKSYRKARMTGLRVLSMLCLFALLLALTGNAFAQSPALQPTTQAGPTETGVAKMSVTRPSHSATELNDSKILVAGGDIGSSKVTNSAKLYQHEPEHNPKSLNGWVIGRRVTGENVRTAAILYTDDGGETWAEQGDPAKWQGMDGNDISAADAMTAWAAVGDIRGKILYTNDGGENWSVQKEMDNQVKQVRALSNQVAWAVTINGHVYRTTDGGENWISISTGDITMDQVNRMDAVGNSIWIADEGNQDDNPGQVVFSTDFGKTWQAKELKDADGIARMGHNVRAYNEQIVWFAIWYETILFRTDDGGKNIRIVHDGFAANDLDDMCAPDENTLWLAQYTSFNSGAVYRAVLAPDEEKAEITQMNINYPYAYGGVFCYSNDIIWVLGYNSEENPQGIILHTSDGGENWTRQQLPPGAHDVQLWKGSFVRERGPENRADLSNLTLSEGLLNPSFAPNTTVYTVAVGQDVSSISITVTLADENATLTIGGAAATSGVAKTVILGAAGTSTPVAILVTTAGGTTEKTYTVTVNRAGTTTAAVPKYIFYENAGGDLVRADYEQAINDLFKPNPDRRLLNAIRDSLNTASQGKKAIYVLNEGGRVVDYGRALIDGLSYTEAFNNFDYWAAPQNPVKELVINPLTGEPEEREL
jgi:photosystem II stability/assembly factor-like uncharacterized protein